MDALEHEILNASLRLQIWKVVWKVRKNKEKQKQNFELQIVLVKDI